MPRLYESINERSHAGPCRRHAAARRCTRSIRAGWQFAIKHAIDRSVRAARAARPRRPLMALIAALVKLSSRGPVLFRQRRVGRDGREFDVLKFRTMASRATPPARRSSCSKGRAPAAIEGEDRRTAIGRWLRDLSLDELPQLLNVLRGDMSLVGPAPGAPGVRAAVRRARSPATRIATGSSPASPAGRRSTACADRRRSPTGSSGTTTTSRTGRCGWTSGSWCSRLQRFCDFAIANGRESTPAIRPPRAVAAEQPPQRLDAPFGRQSAFAHVYLVNPAHVPSRRGIRRDAGSYPASRRYLPPRT